LLQKQKRQRVKETNFNCQLVVNFSQTCSFFVGKRKKKKGILLKVFPFSCKPLFFALVLTLCQKQCSFLPESKQWWLWQTNESWNSVKKKKKRRTALSLSVKSWLKQQARKKKRVFQTSKCFFFFSEREQCFQREVLFFFFGHFP
jgi:hypothetical protein